MRVAAVLSALVAAATAVSAQQEGGAVTNCTVDAEYVTVSRQEALMMGRSEAIVLM